MIISLLLAVFTTSFGLIIGLIIVSGVIVSMFLKPKQKPKSVPEKIESESNTEQQYYRYNIIDMNTGKIVFQGNDYVQMCRIKRDLGLGMMIKDNEYVKKGIIL